MRLLHLAQTLNRRMGGFATALYPLQEECLRQGHESWLLGLDADPEDLSGRRDIISLPSNFMSRFYYSPLYPVKAKALAPEVDSIHVHGLWVYPNFLAGKLARESGKPLVIHPHGMLEPWAMNRSRWKKNISRFLFEEKNFKQARLWRALTDAEASQIRAVCPQANVVVIPNGIDATAFEPAVSPLIVTEKYPHLFNKKWMLFMSRIHQKKGLDILIESWSKLHRHHPDWHLIIAGPDDGYAGALGELIDAHDLSERVTLTGMASGDFKRALLKNSQLFVLPSYSEGFSMAVLEAMASGLPVLVSGNCNFPEVAASEAGVVIDPSEGELTRCLGETLKLPEYFLDEMGKKGAQLIRTKYSWRQVAESLIRASNDI